MPLTFDECYQALVDAGGEPTRARYDEWVHRRDLQEAGVVDFVRRYDHALIYDLKRGDFDDVVKRTQHPFEGIDQKNPIHAEGIKRVRDLATPWSMMQLFHRWIDEFGAIPTWQEWNRWLKGAGAPFLWAHWCETTHYDGSDQHARDLVNLGAAWRLGNLYYSALRELDVMTALRAKGEGAIYLHYHLLADALFLCDLWTERKIVSIFIPNDEFKTDEAGRKLRPEAFLTKSHGFECKQFLVERQKTGGKYWPVGQTTLNQIRAFCS